MIVLIDLILSLEKCKQKLKRATLLNQKIDYNYRSLIRHSTSGVDTWSITQR